MQDAAVPTSTAQPEPCANTTPRSAIYNLRNSGALPTPVSGPLTRPHILPQRTHLFSAPLRPKEIIYDFTATEQRCRSGMAPCARRREAVSFLFLFLALLLPNARGSGVSWQYPVGLSCPQVTPPAAPPASSVHTALAGRSAWLSFRCQCLPP